MAKDRRRTDAGAIGSGRATALGVLAVGAVLFLTRYNTAPLSEPDEARYAEVAREMLQSGDYVTPRFDHVRYMAKPPLLFWMTAGSFALLRPTEFAGRLPCKLTAIASMLVCYLLGSALFDRRAGLLAALVLGTSGFYFGQSQLLRFDTPLSLVLLLAFLLFWKAQRAPSAGHRVLYWFFFYIALATTIIIKGPAFTVLVALTIGLCYVILRALRWRRQLPDDRPRGPVLHAVGIHALLVSLAVAAVVVPWYALAEKANPGFLRYFLFGENVQRALSEHGHQQPWWYFFLWAPLMFLPWTVFLPMGFAAAWRRFREAGDAARPWALCIAWFCVWFAAFSASRTKLQVYLIPAMPALALMVGKVLGDISRRAKSERLSIGARVSLGTFAGATLLLAGAGLWYLWAKYGWIIGCAAPVWVQIALLVACVGMLALMGLALLRKRRWQAVLWGCAASGAAMLLLGGLMEAIAYDQSPRPLASIATLQAQRMQQETGNAGRIIVYGAFKDMRGAVFYTSAAPSRRIIVDKMPQEWSFDPEGARRSGLWFEEKRIGDLLLSDRQIWCLTKRSKYEKFPEAERHRFRVLATHGDMLLFVVRNP